MIGVCVMLVIRMVVVMTHCICKGSIASTGCRSTVVLLPPLLMRIHDGEQGSSAKRALNTRNSRTVLNHNGWDVRMKVISKVGQRSEIVLIPENRQKSWKSWKVMEHHGKSRLEMFCNSWRDRQAKMESKTMYIVSKDQKSGLMPSHGGAPASSHQGPGGPMPASGWFGRILVGVGM